MNAETIESQLARTLKRAHPPLVMTMEDIADLTGYAVNYVRNDLQHQPGFPPRLDRFKQPRWDRAQVLAWAGVQSS